MSEPVLIVDDSLTVRMNLVELLETAGFSVVACSTGAEARTAFTRDVFSLVILDILLPDADGLELLMELREIPSARRTPVMLLSTETEVQDRIRGLTTGADEYIGKPYDPDYVVARARELVHGGENGASSSRNAILVIDDSATFRAKLKEMFEAASYDVVVAGTGEEGLRLAAHLRPAAIVVDSVLPGIDGGTVIRRIRFDAALRGVPCLLLTGSEDEGAEIRALDSGADAFARKEDDIAVVLARLRAMLRSAGTPVEGQVIASLMGPKKILAVDDSDTYLQELAEALRAGGYDVVQVHSGEEALELLAVQSVDCILLDLLMPGIGGEETCRRIKAVPSVRDIPIVMLTALEDRETMIQGLAAGADDFVSKSNDFAILQAKVAAQLRRMQFETENRTFRQQLVLREMEAAEARAAKALAEVRASLADELELRNKELDAFSYSVAHDLRAPLRSIDGFCQALLEDYLDKLDEQGQKYLHYVRESAQQMAGLIDDLLSLSRVTRAELRREPVNLTEIARGAAARLERQYPEREVAVTIAEGLATEGDAQLLTIALDNLLGNAWKFSGKTANARIEVGVARDDGSDVFFVRDNGAGFDPAYASKLFGVFQRLHSTKEFDGTGIGLATVQRIVRRHGGHIWAEGEVGRGATFFFTFNGGAAPATGESKV